MTGEKLSFVFKISQPPNTSQKWFSTQNVPVDVMFEVTDSNCLDFLFVDKF